MTAVGGYDIAARGLVPELEENVYQILSEFSAAHALTPRERQTFLLICTGLKNAAIATRLGVSEATVRLHITNLHRKLGTGGKADFLPKILHWYVPANGHGSKSRAAARR